VKVPLGAKGGMILLSTDVNATVGKGIRGWFAAKLRTSWQRRRRDPLVDHVILEQLANARVAVGWSIGAMVVGRYYDPEKKVLYVERSFSVEVLDAPYPLLKAIAEKLRRTFRQQEVILKSYDTEEAEHIRQELAR
jgi:hypothetical protein